MTLNKSTKLSALKQKNDRRLPFARQGWEDARTGKAINFTILDRAPAAFAVTYEMSRYLVLTLREAGKAVPQWKSYHSFPPLLQKAWKQACSLNVIDRHSGQLTTYPF